MAKISNSDEYKYTVKIDPYLERKNKEMEDYIKEKIYIGSIENEAEAQINNEFEKMLIDSKPGVGEQSFKVKMPKGIWQQLDEMTSALDTVAKEGKSIVKDIEENCVKTSTEIEQVMGGVRKSAIYQGIMNDDGSITTNAPLPNPNIQEHMDANGQIYFTYTPSDRIYINPVKTEEVVDKKKTLEESAKKYIDRIRGERKDSHDKVFGSPGGYQTYNEPPRFKHKFVNTNFTSNDPLMKAAMEKERSEKRNTAPEKVFRKVDPCSSAEEGYEDMLWDIKNMK